MMNKYLSLFLFSACLLNYSHCSFANELSCPSVEKLKTDTVFIQAVRIPLHDIWGVYSDAFIHEGKQWNILIKTYLPGIRDRQGAYRAARKKFAEATLMNSTPTNVDQYIKCGYSLKQGDGIIVASSPPYYGPVP